MTSSNRLSIAIVGGGIGGLCLAIGLLPNEELDVSVYEAAPAFSEIGAGVALGPNAQRALALISPAAEQAFLLHATTSQSPECQKIWFDFRNGKEGPHDGEILSQVENETGQRTVHRAKFRAELVKLIPQDIAHFGKRLVGINKRLSSGSGLWELVFADGTTVTGDCVISADGVHSTIVYRGLIPMDAARDGVGEFAENSYMWCGEGGMVMTYPIDDGETMNVVATRDGKASWGGPPYTKSVDREVVQNDFAGWGKIPGKVIELLEQPTMWAILDHFPAPYYYSGNIAIMGDAAHATTPFQGAGAGQAIEDALVLSALFQQVKTPGQIKPELAAYDRVRRLRTQKVVATSRDALRLFCFNDGFVNEDGQRWETWDSRMDWLWGIDLPKQNEEALAAYRDLVDSTQQSARKGML